MGFRIVGSFLNGFQVLVKAYRFQSVLIMGWMLSVAFWPLFCEFKIYVRLVSLSLQGGLFVRRFHWFSDHLGVLVSLMAFILGCEILFYMLTSPSTNLHILGCGACVSIFACLVSSWWNYLLCTCHFSASLKFDIMLLHSSFF